MCLSIAFSPTTGCTSWPTISQNYYPLSKYPIPWPEAKSSRRHHTQAFDGHQIPPHQPRPLKRVRTGQLPRPLRSSSRVFEEDELFALPPGFQLPQITVTDEGSKETGHKFNNSNKTLARQIDHICPILKASPLSWIDRFIYPQEPEDEGLAVSPLETPSGFLEQHWETAKDPLGDIEMRGEEHNEEPEATEMSSYTLTRYLADSEGLTTPQEPSISRPDFLRSTAPIDIRKELRKLESDISDVFQGMNISDDGIPEIHLQDLEASVGSENLDGLEGIVAENETGSQELPENGSEIFSLDGDEPVLVGPRDISPELESWISKSSLIVGSILKPLHFPKYMFGNRAWDGWRRSWDPWLEFRTCSIIVVTVTKMI